MEKKKAEVLEKWNKTAFLKNKTIEKRGWTLDVMSCIDTIKDKEFSLDEIYNFSERLRILHPENNFIQDKIRQQLQVLRDKGYLEFLGRGKYRKR